MNTTEQLRHLPSVDEVLRSERLAGLHRLHGQRRITAWTRSAIDDIRHQLLGGKLIAPSQIFDRVVDDVHRQQAKDRGQAVQRVINATGIILHTNLGRSPLADAAIERVRQATLYASVELDLDSGRRSQRGQRVCNLLAQLAGSEDALVVNNCAAATMLVLQAIAFGREVIVSRGQLVEIGGGFRLPDVFRSAGVTLREIGTTNRTYLRDYESAIGDQTAAIIRVHRSNFAQTGFVTEPTIDELVSIERSENLPVIDDLGSGCVSDLSPYGFDEPTVDASVRSGADLSLFSGDKLFGGPQAGIIVGRRSWIDRLRTSPMMRAMRVDKLTLAALEATTEIHLAGKGTTAIPVLKMISTDARQVRAKCERVVREIADRCPAEIVESDSQVGGGSLPGGTIDSFAVKIVVPHIDRLTQLLRSGLPAVQGRVADDSLLLDLRTVSDAEMDSLIMRLRDSIDRLDHQA